MAARGGRRLVVSMTGAGLVIGAVIGLRSRRDASQPDAPADVSFMRALRAALRRDLSRLRDVTAQVDGSAGPPAAMLGKAAALRPWAPTGSPSRKTAKSSVQRTGAQVPRVAQCHCMTDRAGSAGGRAPHGIPNGC